MWDWFGLASSNLTQDSTRGTVGPHPTHTLPVPIRPVSDGPLQTGFAFKFILTCDSCLRQKARGQFGLGMCAVSKSLHGQGVCWRFGEAFQVFKLGKVDSEAFWMGRGENCYFSH